MNRLVLRTLTAFALLVPAAAHAATLTIKVENVGKQGGLISLSLYDEASWSKDPDSPIASANVPAKAPVTVVTLNDIKPGVYGVKVFQDFDRSGNFKTNFVGLPLEPYGFSRDAKPFLSAPSFQHAKFTVGGGTNEITIHLQ